MLDSETRTDDKLILFTTINKAKFRKPVEPGDQIRFELDIVKRRRNLCVMNGKGYVEKDLVVEAELSAVVIQKEEASL
ncbi:hotdog domain-containing protein, partial [Candidatus Omnitrophota bacterium]